MQTAQRIRMTILIFLAAALVLTAALGPYLAPKDPFEIHLLRSYRPPDAENLMGTDKLGRDLCSRILYAARGSFALTFTMVMLVAFIGVVIGTTAGYTGGLVDSLAMQAADVLMAFPTLVFAIAIAGIWGPGIFHTVCALAMVSWAKYAYMTRGLVAEILGKNYVVQARFGGSGMGRIIVRYILPNILPHIIIMAALDIGEMLMTISALSFLGLVSQPPFPEWGHMLAECRGVMLIHPHMMIFPSLALFITVIVFNLLGDSLRDYLDPKNGG